ncbi:MAG TPA: very short patch repair endonuclease [Vitreimonas sp.]|uniref:very short patch repair endonuclease n=1 Tax=Vitreimonas sp. TaxID=3069702 RepID=UPI002D5816DD|nr:very short patch repair endonuclease [Vitreimonas sp.]HYD86245.1 very short patch repair endonuclease [Vitreimonas sp.]
MGYLIDARRSANMAAVRSKDTTPELVVRRAAHRMGLRFRLHRRDLPGSPDLVLAKHGLVVFVHGCFWHRHPRCKRASIPKTRSVFWRTKLEGNAKRDQRVRKALRMLGWRVLVIWECQLKHGEQRIEAMLKKAIGKLPRA